MLLKNKLERTPVKTNKFDVPVKGIVVDNEDPKKLGRVKCSIEGMFDGIDKESLPWISSWCPSGLGGGVNLSFFAVPNEGSELVIEFPYKNPYAPFYTGYWQSEKTHQTLFDTNYPRRYGWIDELDNYWFVDREEEHIKLHHSSGTRVEIFKDGNVEVETMDKVDLIVHGDCNATIDENLIAEVKGNTLVDTDGFTSLHSDSYFEISSNVKIDLNAPVINFSAWGMGTSGWFTGYFRHLGEHIHQGNKTHTGHVNQTGNYDLFGTLKATVNALIAGIYFKTHKHGGVDPGPADTDVPKN